MMWPIDEFYALLETRTSAAIEKAEAAVTLAQHQLLVALGVLGLRSYSHWLEVEELEPIHHGFGAGRATAGGSRSEHHAKRRQTR